MSEVAPAVALDAVRKTYQRGGQPVHALRDVSLRLPRGSYTAVVGPRGCGASTLLAVLGCLAAPTSGRVVVDGTDVTQLDPTARTDFRAETIGVVFPGTTVLPRRSAVENAALPLLFQGMPGRQRRRRATTALERAGLPASHATRPAAALSGVHRHRVALARALVADPAVVLVDEPAAALDADAGREIMAAITDQQDADTTVLVATHTARVADHADRRLALHDGAIRHPDGDTA